MTITTWFLPSMLALLLWGVANFLPKLALRTLPPLHLAVYACGFGLCGSVALLAFYGFHLDRDPQGILLSMLIGIFGTLGGIMFVMAIRHGSMSNGVVVASLYPVPAAALSFFILGERLTQQQSAGVLLGICALVLMVMGRRDAEAGE